MNAQQKNLVGLLVAAGLAGAVGLYAYFGVLKGDARQAEQKAADEKLVSFGSDAGEVAFSALSVTSRGQTTTLDRREEGWFVTSPIQTRADESVVEQLVRELQTGRVAARIDEKPDEAALKRYGLSPPQFAVSGSANAGGAPRSFKVEGGIENPYDGSVYLRRGDDPAVYTVGVAVRTALDRTTLDLRDKRLFDVNPADVARVQVSVDGKPRYAVARDGRTAWKLEQPSVAEADAELIGELLASLLNERVTGFPEPEPQHDAALAKPAQEVTLTLTNGESRRLVAAKFGDGILARRGEERVLLNPSALEHLDKPAEALRDRTVLRFDRDAVARVVFQPAGGGAPVEVRVASRDADAGSNGESWNVTAPERGPVKAWKMASILWALASLKADAPAAPAPRDWNALGLGDGARRVQLYDAAGGLLTELVLGAQVKGAAERLHARGTGPGLFEVDAARLGELPNGIDDLLDRAGATPDAGSAAAN